MAWITPSKKDKAVTFSYYKHLEKRLEPLLVNQEQWKRDKSYLWHEDRIVVPSDRVPALLKWTHESSGHVGADRTLRLFKQWFHTTWSDDQLRKTLQPIVDACPCRSCRLGDIRDRGLYWTLPIPHCANSVLYVDYTEMPKFGGYDFALMVPCGLTRFTWVFSCTKHITGQETIKILLKEWFCVYGASKEINSDEDVRVRSDTDWYKRVLRSLNVQGMPMWVEDENVGYAHLEVSGAEEPSQHAHEEVAGEDLEDLGNDDDHPPPTGSDRRSPRKSTQVRAFQAGDADDDEPEASHAPKPEKPKTKAAAEPKQATLTQPQGMKRTLSLPV